MFLFIVACILIVIAVLAALVMPSDSEVPKVGVVGALLLIGVLIGLVSTTTVVPAKHYGVLTTFGKVSERTLTPGLHMKAPWQNVKDIDGTIQVDEYSGDGCIYVRIGDGSRACVTTTIRWRINGDAADTIYSDHRSDDPTETLRKAVVSTQFKAAMQKVLGDYNPVDAFKEVEAGNADVKEVALSPDYEQVTEELTKEMNALLGDDPLVEVQNITISFFSLSDTTQAKINDLMGAVADTRIASQRKATATEDAAANKILSDSVSNDPNVLVSKCLDIVETAVEKGNEALPAGFTCWNGSGGSVVVPAK